MKSRESHKEPSQDLRFQVIVSNFRIPYCALMTHSCSIFWRSRDRTVHQNEDIS
jgi:hypothetical protein